MTAWGGVFGKTPGTGDFVSRGLPADVRRPFDLWVSANLASRADPWPEGGVRGLLPLGVAPALFVALPSHDAAGRRFPLAALTNGEGLCFEVAEAWCGRLLPALSEAADGDGSLDRVLAVIGELESAIPRDTEDGDAAVWHAGGPPLEPTEEALDEIFSSG